MCVCVCEHTYIYKADPLRFVYYRRASSSTDRRPSLASPQRRPPTWIHIYIYIYRYRYVCVCEHVYIYIYIRPTPSVLFTTDAPPHSPTGRAWRSHRGGRRHGYIHIYIYIYMCVCVNIYIYDADSLRFCLLQTRLLIHRPAEPGVATKAAADMGTYIDICVCVCEHVYVYIYIKPTPSLHFVSCRHASSSTDRLSLASQQRRPSTASLRTRSTRGFAAL